LLVLAGLAALTASCAVAVREGPVETREAAIQIAAKVCQPAFPTTDMSPAKWKALLIGERWFVCQISDDRNRCLGPGLIISKTDGHASQCTFVTSTD
jgi:hypothetical protein